MDKLRRLLVYDKISMHTSSFNCCDLLCCYSSIFLYAELFNDPTRWTINYGFKWGWWLYLSDHRWTWIWRSSSRVKKWRQMEDQITYIYIHTTHLCGYSCYANTIFTWRLFFLIPTPFSCRTIAFPKICKFNANLYRNY